MRWDCMVDAAIWRDKGLFESALGRFCLKHPKKARLISRRKFHALSRVWKVGTEVTLEMVEGLQKKKRRVS